MLISSVIFIKNFKQKNKKKKTSIHQIWMFFILSISIFYQSNAIFNEKSNSDFMFCHREKKWIKIEIHENTQKEETKIKKKEL